MTKWQFFPASSFYEYTEQWDELNQTLYQLHPMLDSRFVAALLKHFGGPQILLAVYPSNAEHSGNLLLLQRKRWGAWTTFLPSQSQIAPLLCGNPQALQDLFISLPGFVFAIDILCQDPLYTFSTEVCQNIDTFAHAVTMNIDLAATFEYYWQQRSRKLQQNLKRYFNRLSKNGISHQLKVFSNQEDLLSALYRYAELETKSWKGEIGTAIGSQNEQGRFYGDLLNAFSATEQAEVVELYLNDQLAASRINVLNRNILITLKTTYDETLSEYAPGRLLLYLLIEREFALKRVQHIEFYTNATPDQLSWSSGRRNIEHLTIYRSANVRRLIAFLHSVKARLAKK